MESIILLFPKSNQTNKQKGKTSYISRVFLAKNFPFPFPFIPFWWLWCNGSCISVILIQKNQQEQQQKQN